MACELFNGIKLDCSTNTGGVSAIWISPVSNISLVTVNEVGGAAEAGDGTVTSVVGPVFGYASITVTIPGSTFQNLQFQGDVTSIYQVGKTVQFTADTPTGQSGFSGPITSSSYSSVTNETVVNIGSLTTFQMIPSFNYSTLVTGGNVSFLKFETLRNGASFEQPSTINLENGSTFFTHTLQFQIPRQDVAKRNKIYQLASGNGKFLAVIKDMNGEYWLSGIQADGSLEMALQVSTSNAMTGKAKGDMNGYDVTLTAELNTLAFKINPSLVALVDGTTNW